MLVPALGRQGPARPDGLRWSPGLQSDPMLRGGPPRHRMCPELAHEALTAAVAEVRTQSRSKMAALEGEIRLTSGLGPLCKGARHSNAPKLTLCDRSVKGAAPEAKCALGLADGAS